MIAKSAIASAAEIISARRSEAAVHAADMRAEIYAALPELYNIDAEFYSLLGAAGDSSKRLSELHEKKKALLAKGGFTENDLLPHYTCPLCEDTGFVDGHRCECFRRLIKAQAGLSLPAGLASRCSFDNIHMEYYPEENSERSPRRIMTAITAACREYADDFSCGSDSLLFIGAPGLGKTHLSIAMARRVLERGYGVLYTPVQPLMDAFERLRFDRAPSALDREQTALAADIDLLVLDDLGAEFVTAFSQSTLYNVINGRLVSGLPTIISTNLLPAEIAKTYTPRIASRILYDYKPYIFAGRDVRLARNS